MKALPVLLIIAISAIAVFGGTKKNPVEAGTVKWLRDYDAAMVKSEETGKPVFLLFQEIPGCAGCQQFGREVLSDSQVVEAIETEFVPLLVPNNQPGEAENILQKYKEPAWNYQVVRFLDAKGVDLIPRKDKVWNTPYLASRMGEALEKAGRPVPKYLKALGAVGDFTKVDTVAFSMFCFWTGEAKLGTIPGVVTTEAGFFDGHEVTLVRFRTDEISLPELAKKAAEFECANAIYLTKDDQRIALEKAGSRLRIGQLDAKGYRKAPETDQKRQLIGTAIKNLAMSQTQAMHVNSLIRQDAARALQWLSPRQQAALK